jgi:mannitol/fructose-specific phosphotransferase system IIA component (Ntr-type)
MDLPAAGKSETLKAMTDRLEAIGRLADSAQMHRLLMDREELMTTGVRRGFAFPHAFDPRVQESFLTLGVVPEGLDYASLDGHPVQFIFLLLGPPGNQSVHLRILARVSRLTSQPDVFHLLSEATDPQALVEVVSDVEQQLKTSPYVFPDSRE